jgi:hypothetical protein
MINPPSPAGFFVSGDTMPQPATADRLERLAREMHSVAFDFREPARSVTRADYRIGEVERICAEARKAVRG